MSTPPAISTGYPFCPTCTRLLRINRLKNWIIGIETVLLLLAIEWITHRLAVAVACAIGLYYGIMVVASIYEEIKSIRAGRKKENQL